ncbi:alpha/beta fold hydrolase [Streptomyces sp. NBC_01465]|uniref:alpha/beta fold hydrolase n=1 Tax=Streptomyces sp. NBC_01465 TaxID=2903878 RepID=UPI002E30D990|nr:alpha/beta hydrolase [Streptomyces sp. NBC_01465]
MTELLAVSEDGTPITALDEGTREISASRPVLLVVHPGGSDISTWDAVARSLAADFRVVRVRRRIYVSGADIAPDHSMADEAADILAVARLLGPRPVFLVGHSSGAVAALEAARAEPSAFGGLFLYEPPLPTRSLLAGVAGLRARAAIDAGDPVEAMRIHMRDVVRMPAPEVDGMFADPRIAAAFAVHAAAQITDDEALDALGVGIDRFKGLELPVTLLEGDQSPEHLRERTADLAAVLPDARIVTLVGEGHIAQLTAPDRLESAIRDAVWEVCG